MKRELEKKDIDISIAINVTPATISNWQNSKTIPRKKEIVKIFKYFIEELEYKNLNIAEKINNYILDVEENLSAKDLNDILVAKEQGKYNKVMILILEAYYEMDKKNRNKKSEDSDNISSDESIEINIENVAPKKDDEFQNKEIRVSKYFGNYKRRYVIISIVSIVTILLTLVIISNELENNKNLIVNGGFEDGLDYWGNHAINSGGLEFNASIDNNTTASGSRSMYILTSFLTVNHPPETENWYTIQICQDGLNVIAGEKYVLEFKVKSDNTRDCEIIIQKKSDKDNMDSLVSFAMPGQIFSVDRNWQTIRRVFTAKYTSSKDTRFSFGIGGMESELWFDDVSIHKYNNLGDGSVD